MDNQARQLLLKRVIDYAILFQRQKRRRSLSSRDVEDAIYALGLRPLLSSIDANGNETVSPSDIVTDPLVGSRSSSVSLSIIVPVDPVWTQTSDHFRKRKIVEESTRRKPTGFSDRAKMVIDTIVDCCHSGAPIPSGVTNREIVLAGWMLGLHFSDIVSCELSSVVNWRFIRNALWFLQRALKEGPVSPPWKSGLEAIADGKAASIEYDSGDQAQLIQKICRNMVNSLR